MIRILLSKFLDSRKTENRFSSHQYALCIFGKNLCLCQDLSVDVNEIVRKAKQNSRDTLTQRAL